MHPLDVLGRMAFRGEKWLDGVVDYCRKRDHVPQWNIRGGFHVVGLVLLYAGVAQRDLLLIIEPILVVAPETSVQNPLPESQPTLSRVVRIRFAIRSERVLGEVRVGGDDASPFLNDFFGLVRKHLAGLAQVSLVLLGEIHGFLQQFQVAERNRGSGCFWSAVRVSRNLFR